ncbi:hypothetical protein POM88_045714 [Heracleum sosnowskyi]|uniref:Uncharacterized protein n=1 Tax=Heracleum sosnowskyi TaxID=360622 RepID=A0AAD8H7Y1_9APIA|nr:hypothetical protein POM88_045714 [Heracleum sosnowskyi]
MGRGPNEVPKAPTNQEDQTLIQIRPPPDDNDFTDHKITKCISQLCLQNWPTPAITWASTPVAHQDAVWAEFKRRFKWADEQGLMISSLFWQKCTARTKDILSKDREKAKHNAGIDHPGHAMEHMHEAGGGEKAKGTYKGGSISQLQHMVVKESQSQGTPIHWLDVYVETRDGLPDAVNIVPGVQDPTTGMGYMFTLQAWELWISDRVLELIDSNLELPSSFLPLKFIHVGLLCVQESPADRPTMYEVLAMFSNEHMQQVFPKRPAFTSGGSLGLGLVSTENYSINTFTTSVMDGR